MNFTKVESHSFYNCYFYFLSIVFYSKPFLFYYISLHYFANVFMMHKLVSDEKSVISHGGVVRQSVRKEYNGVKNGVIKVLKAPNMT